MKIVYIVELEPDVWGLRPDRSSGFRGRTASIRSAARYPTEKQAQRALERARLYRPWPAARVKAATVEELVAR